MLISIIMWLIFGALVGWLAGIVMKSGTSLGTNIILGIVGSILGGFVASLIGLGSLSGGYSFNLWNIIISVLGACLLIFIIRLVRR